MKIVYAFVIVMCLSNACCKAVFGLPITLRQNRRFSYLDVRDLPTILKVFIEENPLHKSYNIVPDGYVELQNIAELVRKISGKDLKIKIEKSGYGLDYYGSNQRLKAEFPNVKFMDFRQSVQNLYEYYKQNKEKLDVNLLLEDK